MTLALSSPSHRYANMEPASDSEDELAGIFFGEKRDDVEVIYKMAVQEKLKAIGSEDDKVIQDGETIPPMHMNMSPRLVQRPEMHGSDSARGPSSPSPRMSPLPSSNKASLTTDADWRGSQTLNLVPSPHTGSPVPPSPRRSPRRSRTPTPAPTEPLTSDPKYVAKLNMEFALLSPKAFPKPPQPDPNAMIISPVETSRSSALEEQCIEISLSEDRAMNGPDEDLQPRYPTPTPQEYNSNPVASPINGLLLSPLPQRRSSPRLKSASPAPKALDLRFEAAHLPRLPSPLRLPSPSRTPVPEEQTRPSHANLHSHVRTPSPVDVWMEPVNHPSAEAIALATAEPIPQSLLAQSDALARLSEFRSLTNSLRASPIPRTPSPLPLAQSNVVVRHPPRLAALEKPDPEPVADDKKEEKKQSPFSALRSQFGIATVPSLTATMVALGTTPEKKPASSLPPELAWMGPVYAQTQLDGSSDDEGKERTKKRRKAVADVDSDAADETVQGSATRKRSRKDGRPRPDKRKGRMYGQVDTTERLAAIPSSPPPVDPFDAPSKAGPSELKSAPRTPVSHFIRDLKSVSPASEAVLANLTFEISKASSPEKSKAQENEDDLMSRIHFHPIPPSKSIVFNSPAKVRVPSRPGFSAQKLGSINIAGTTSKPTVEDNTPTKTPFLPQLPPLPTMPLAKPSKESGALALGDIFTAPPLSKAFDSSRPPTNGPPISPPKRSAFVSPFSLFQDSPSLPSTSTTAPPQPQPQPQPPPQPNSLIARPTRSIAKPSGLPVLSAKAKTSRLPRPAGISKAYGRDRMPANITGNTGPVSVHAVSVLTTDRSGSPVRAGPSRIPHLSPSKAVPTGSKIGSGATLNHPAPASNPTAIDVGRPDSTTTPRSSSPPTSSQSPTRSQIQPESASDEIDSDSARGRRALRRQSPRAPLDNPLPAHRRAAPSRPQGPAFESAVSAAQLKSITAQNTIRNQQFFNNLDRKVIFKEGKRPPSPSSRVRTMLQREKDDAEKAREERARRRGIVKFGDSEDDDEDMAGPSGSNSPEPPLMHPRAPGEDEDYQTPQSIRIRMGIHSSQESDQNERRKRKAEDSDGSDRAETSAGCGGRKKSKFVRWNKMLAVKPSSPEAPGLEGWKDQPAGKSCLAREPTVYRLDRLGNVPEATQPLAGLIKPATVQVVRLIYADDPGSVQAASPVEEEPEEPVQKRPKRKRGSGN